MKKIYFQVKVSSHATEGFMKNETQVWTSKQFNTLDEAKKNVEMWKRVRESKKHIDNTGLDPNECDYVVIDKIWIEHVVVYVDQINVVEEC